MDISFRISNWSADIVGSNLISLDKAGPNPTQIVSLAYRWVKVWLILRLLDWGLTFSLKSNERWLETDSLPLQEWQEILGDFCAISDELDELATLAENQNFFIRALFTSRLQESLMKSKEKLDDQIEAIEIALSPEMHSIIEDAANMLRG